MKDRKFIFLCFCLCFIYVNEIYGQNKYRSLAIERTRHQNNQTPFLGVALSPKTIGVNGGFNFFLDDFLQVGGGISFSKFRYASYAENIAVINLQSQYDFLRLWNNNVILSGIGIIGFERTFVTSETEIVLERNYPFKVIPQLGINSDFYINPDIAVFANFTQGFVVSSSYLDRWRYRTNVGVKYFLGR